MKKNKTLTFDIHHFSSLESTNKTAKSFFETSVHKLEENSVHVFSADSQTCGYGKAGRSWFMKKGDVAVSFLFPIFTKIPDNLTQIMFVFSLSVGETLEYFGVSGSSISYKWPNDILINNKKIAGILLETDTILFKNLGGISYLLCGIGVNLCHYPTKDLCIFPATSLKQEGYKIPKPQEFIDILSDSIDKYYSLWKKRGFDFIRNAWVEKVWQGDGVLKVKFDKEKTVEGTFIEIKEDGALCLQCRHTGKVQTFYSADLF